MTRALALAVLTAALAAAAAVAASGPPPALLHPAKLAARSPASYAVVFRTTKGTFVVSVRRAQAPRGADRFYDLVRGRFFDGVEFFRVVKGFVVQFGISPYPAVSKAWLDAGIKDDPVKGHNLPGTVTFAATSAPDSRTTQLFVNLADNTFLDTQGFAPVGRVTSGMAVVQKLYAGYGNAPSGDQQQITFQGNAFLKRKFPKLDSIVTARIK